MISLLEPERDHFYTATLYISLEASENEYCYNVLYCGVPLEEQIIRCHHFFKKEDTVPNFWIVSIFWQNSLAACSCDVDVGLSR